MDSQRFGHELQTIDHSVLTAAVRRALDRDTLLGPSMTADCKRLREDSLVDRCASAPFPVASGKR